MVADRLSTTFAALADPTRRAILGRLASGAATVKEISAPFAMSGPAVSRHLKVLERAGLITRGRDAQWRPCLLQAEPLKEVAEFAERYRRFWEASYARLDTYMQQLIEQERRDFMTAAETPGQTHFSMPSDLEIQVTRVVDAPRRLVWEAYTNPKHLPNWCLGPDGWTMPVCEIDLRVGGAWRFVWRQEGGMEMEMRGTYLEVTPPERLVNTEVWGAPWPETKNTVTFVERDGKTLITTLILYPSQEARDAAARTGMREGMARTYERLDGYLKTMAQAG